MILKNYTVTDTRFWTGRIDDPNDLDSLRMHQIIQLLGLNGFGEFLRKTIGIFVNITSISSDETSSLNVMFSISESSNSNSPFEVWITNVCEKVKLL